MHKLRKKLERQQLKATSVSGNPQSRLFYITDRISGTRFLIDTGAEVSVLPPTKTDKKNSSPYTLQAVNKSSIATFGEKSMTIDIGLRRAYIWIFIIAEVPFPIIGADFFSQFSLVVDVKNYKLIDSQTELEISGNKTSVLSPKPMFSIPETDNVFLDLLSQFPELTRLSSTLLHTTFVQPVHQCFLDLGDLPQINCQLLKLNSIIC